MEKVVIRQLYRHLENHEGKKVQLTGWVRSNRAQKAFGFIMVNDGTFFHSVQVVYEDQLENFKSIQKIRVGSAILVEGTVVATPNAKQPFEIKATNVELLGDSPEDYPIQPKRHTREFLREVAHLRPRTNLFTAVFRVRSLAAYAIHKFFQERDFVYVHTPIITASDAEGAGEMFQVTSLDLEQLPLDENKNVDYSEDFFGKPANLTVSGQLEAEAYALAFRNVYTFGPTFRAENSNTYRHAAEFWMVEPEIAFGDLWDVMDLAEDMTKFVVQYVLEHAPEEMAFFDQFVQKGIVERLEKLLQSEFHRCEYTEAIEILKKAPKTFENNVEWGVDLASEHERYLTEEYFKAPVFIINYPKDIKAFYMRQNDDGKTVAATDMLVPGIGELIGGSQREEREDVLRKRMEEMGVNQEELYWYLELRKYGGVVHSGYGIGFERLIMYLTGVENIRDVIPFPRTPGNCEF